MASKTMRVPFGTAETSLDNMPAVVSPLTPSFAMLTP
jgi:hypothetical protein